MGIFKQGGFAFATAAAAWVNAIWLGYLLWKQGHLHVEDRLKKFTFRMLLTCGATVVLLKTLQFIIHPLLLRGELIRDLSVVGLVSFGILGFLFISHVMGAFKMNELKLMFSSRT